ncbi:MAG TPA: hypothetical protein VNV38_22790 [Stellaceae bacterium]|jgi:hypothetical protein|nr:hypothetical protein [Stellaceae bacterium]
MNHAPIDADIRRSLATTSPRAFIQASRRHLRRPLPPSATAERVALGMIARHGADAAREAIIHLNRMIDRGDFAARDLWACVVHVIHEQRR